MKIFILIIFIAIGFQSCKKNELCGDPVDTHVAFILKIAETGRALIGEDRMFHPDTIRYLNIDFRFDVVDSLIIFQIHGFDSGVPQLLRLTSTETDTIITSVGKKEFECFDLPKLTSMDYNGTMVFEGELVGVNDDIIQIEK